MGWLFVFFKFIGLFYLDVSILVIKIFEYSVKFWIIKEMENYIFLEIKKGVFIKIYVCEFDFIWKEVLKLVKFDYEEKRLMDIYYLKFINWLEV